MAATLGGSAAVTTAKNESPTRTAQLRSSSGDSPLPTGWQRVTHDSGLTCYVHEQQRLVCWSKPYVLDMLGSPGEFVGVAQRHVPPLSLFRQPPVRERSDNNNDTTSGEKGDHIAPTTVTSSTSASVSDGGD